MVAGGGELVDATHAEAIVWTDPAHPEALTELLTSSPATWIQLPFAGIEKFVAAGTIDDVHTWTCAKGIYGPSTAEHALTLLLAAARCLNVHIRSKTWLERPGSGAASDRGARAPERRLAKGTIAIIGGGGIGRSLIEMLRPLGTEVIVVNRSGETFPVQRARSRSIPWMRCSALPTSLPSRPPQLPRPTGCSIALASKT